MFVVKVPEVVFKTRISIDEAPGFAWKDLTTRDIFAGKRVVLVALPGAFTPTCSSTHLPGYEEAYADLQAQGIDEVFCLSVNDTFTMNSWFQQAGIENVKPIPDGAGEFSRKMGFLVDKTNIGFGLRSWRYSMVVNDGVVEQFFIEPGLGDNVDGDPFEVSDAQTLLAYLEGVEVVSE
jgi:peroxiredoxin|tara:strand:- start:8198 stop:8731 length:534 start_codon:yes stop_codon:yes gene_type:complete